MKLIIYFIVTFVISFLISYITVIRKLTRTKKNKKRKKLRKDAKLPVEVIYLIKRYKLDLERINIKKLLYLVYLVASIDIGVIIVVISPIKNIFLQILVGFIVSIPLILVTYNSIGNYYIKKGLTKNGNENSRK